MRLCSTISDNVEGSGPTSLKFTAVGLAQRKWFSLKLDTKTIN